MNPADRFRSYIAAFNASDWVALYHFYAPDVRLVIGNGTELVGRQSIVEFYAAVKTQTRREIRIVQCFAQNDMLAAELESEFLAIKDAPDFVVRPMAKGDRYYINSFALYELQGDCYSRIRAAVLRREFRPFTG